MLLRTKLLLSFAFVVLLTCTVSYSTYNGLSQINHSNMQSILFSNINLELSNARYEQLRYVHYEKEEYAANYKQHIKKATEDTEKVLATIQIPEDMLEAKALLEATKQAEVTFDNLLNAYHSYQAINKDMGVKGAETIVSMNNLMGEVLEVLNTEPNQTNLEANNYLATAVVSLYDLRIAAINFRATADQAFNLTAQKANQAVMENLELLSVLKIIDQSHINDTKAKYLDYYNSFEILVKTIVERNTIRTDAAKNIAPPILMAANLSDIASKEITESGVAVINQLLIVTAIAIVIAIALAIFLTRNVIAQLGRDPSTLSAMATKVCNNDYNIEDGGPKKGVYANLVAMVTSLKENIEAARSESEKAQEETQKANAAIAVAEEAKHEAEQAKRKGMLEAADQLEGIVAIISSASTELAAQVSESDKAAVDVSNRVSETATAMEEMNSTVIEVARNASIASEVSTNTRAKAENGAVIVKNVVASITMVQEQSLKLKEDMSALSMQAQEINQIMGVISDIADQTNLLALNAAIEAARAGDAGRGFAVVADEVRKLAEKTMLSTTDVGNAIASIQKSSQNSMHQVDTAVENIEKVTRLASESGEALGEIVVLADGSADQVRVIATASEEQSATSEEINRSLTEINSVANNSANAMKEASIAVNELVEQANSLSKLINEMKQA